MRLLLWFVGFFALAILILLAPETEVYGPAGYGLDLILGLAYGYTGRTLVWGRS